MPINARTKGKEGEREFVNRFQPFFPTEIKRNLNQTREGGADIEGCAPFQIEVKRCQKIELEKWWRQVTAACDPSEIPVVAFRQNNCPWRFLLPFSLVVPSDTGYFECSETRFLQFVMYTYKEDENEPT